MMYEKEWENPNYKFLSYDVDNLNWNIHYHESFEICFIIDGEINITIDTVLYNLKQNDSVIIFPRQLHSYETEKSSKMRVITFMPDLIPEFTNRYQNMLPEKMILRRFRISKNILTRKIFLSKRACYILYSEF